MMTEPGHYAHGVDDKTRSYARWLHGQGYTPGQIGELLGSGVDLTLAEVALVLHALADALHASGTLTPEARRHRQDSEPPLLTVPQAAHRLGCSAMTIRRRIDARRFPAVKIGNRAMVPRSFVDRLLALAESGRTVIVEEAAAEWMAAHESRS